VPYRDGRRHYRFCFVAIFSCRLQRSCRYARRHLPHRLQLGFYRHYPEEDLFCSPANPTFFISRAVLCIRNSTADEFNSILIEKIPGPLSTFEPFNHADFNENPMGREELTPEYLRGLHIPSLPPGILRLHIGPPLLLMRNLDPQHSLGNGTRLTLEPTVIA
jgi:hypothetical protein